MNNDNENHNNHNDEDVITDVIINICSNREICESYIGRAVSPLPDFPYGEVCSFKYRKRIISVETAVWTVKYYNNFEGTGIARKNMEMKYFDLHRIMLDI